MANYVKVRCLTENLQCGICQGYIIDATTISECLHSFCKSCIFHFIESIDHRCPTCNQALTDIENCISFDSSLQRLIYQLVPNLLENELNRREQFRLHNLKSSDSMISENTLLNLKLYNIQKAEKPSGGENNNTNLNNKLSRNNSIGNVIGEADLIYDNENSENNDVANRSEIVTVKYVQCIAQTPIGIISRMLRNKYSIPSSYGIKLSHMEHRISDSETLLKLFTSFVKTKDELLDLKYELFKHKIKKKSAEKEAIDSNTADLSSLTIKSSQTKSDIKNIPTFSQPNVPRNQEKIKPHTVNNNNTNNKTITEPLTQSILPPKISNKGSNNVSKKQKKTESPQEAIIFKPSTLKRKQEAIQTKKSNSLKKSNEPEKNTGNLNETVYYSDQNYDEEDDSQEGKLLIVDDENSQNANDKNNNHVLKKNGTAALHESPLDLRIAKK